MDRSETVEEIFETVAEVSPEISKGMIKRRDYADEENPSDEEQVEADIWANELLKEKITSIDGVGEFGSEEDKEITDCGEGLSVAIDPLDGSSNIQTNNIVGTIVGIYEEDLPCAGENLVSAFYIIYGPAITAIKAEDGQVDEFLIDSLDGGVEIRKVTEDIRIEGSEVYGFGGNKKWTDDFRKIASEFSEELKLRYGGALVGDITQTIHYGGIFGYPFRKDAPDGKYRLIVEANPVAYIVETAGGSSSNGEKSVLKVKANEMHQRTPFFAGSADQIRRVEEKLENLSKQD